MKSCVSGTGQKGKKLELVHLLIFNLQVLIFNFVLISVDLLWFYCAWVMYSKWKHPSCFLKTFSKFSAFLCTYLYQKWKHLNACVFLPKSFYVLLCHLWSKLYKIQHLYFFKGRWFVLCSRRIFVMAGLKVWYLLSKLRCCLYSFFSLVSFLHLLHNGHGQLTCHRNTSKAELSRENPEVRSLNSSRLSHRQGIYCP